MALPDEAQAVYDAAHEADSKPGASLADAVAAALRAAANNVGYKWASLEVADYLNKIADELDGGP